MLKSLILASALVLGTVGMAHAGDMGGKSPRPMHDGPCKAIAEACHKAGFERRHHGKDGKGLMADCMKPVMSGKSVAGVAIDPISLDSCKKQHAEHKAKFEAKMKNDPAFAKKMKERKAKWEMHKKEHPVVK